MKLHELRPADGQRHRRKRVGRGTGSGLGKTSGRGQDGQLSRSGGGKGPQFEGGQTPLQMRLPKRGFKNPFRREYSCVNVGVLNDPFDDGAEVTPEALCEHGLIRDPETPVKILGEGELGKKFLIKANAYSTAAKDKIESAGGQAEVI